MAAVEVSHDSCVKYHCNAVGPFPPFIFFFQKFWRENLFWNLKNYGGDPVRPRSQNFPSPIFDVAPSLNAISMIAKSAKPWDDFLTSYDGIG